ncbi:putative ribonuclease H-like domain-containing protein [Tanacetum coccineum]
MTPRAVLQRTGLKPLSTAKARAVNIARFYTRQVNVVRVKGVNAVKSSAYWVWRPTKPNGASLAFKRHNYIDVRGRSKTPQQNGVAKRRDRTLIEAARTMLDDSKLPTTFWAEAVSTACYVPNREGRRKLAFGFLENKPMIEGNGPKWLFDIDSLTQSMKYVPVTAGIISNDSVGTSEEVIQDCSVMPIWKDTSYFDSPTKDVENGEQKTTGDAQKQVEDAPNNENAEQDKFKGGSSIASLETISAIEMLWEWRGIANMDFIKLGGSRVDEMILAMERSGFAEKYGSKTGCWRLVSAGRLEKVRRIEKYICWVSLKGINRKHHFIKACETLHEAINIGARELVEAKSIQGRALLDW